MMMVPPQDMPEAKKLMLAPAGMSLQRAARTASRLTSSGTRKADPSALEEYRSALPPKRSYGPETFDEARAAMREHGIAV